MTDMPEIPFEEWDGTRVQHLTVSPDGTVYVVPSGAHERLHRLLVGDRNPRMHLPDDTTVMRGTKVDLALIGWAQLQNDTMTDRINIDAPDGFADDEVVRLFVTLHDAGSVYIAFYPSEDVQKSTDPTHVSLSHDGERVPVVFG